MSETAEPRSAAATPAAAAPAAPARAPVPVRAASPSGSRLVDPRGRSKAYRPLPAAERDAAVARGLDAYARGAFYLAHEELEAAWMAADDPGERELLGGLIKLAAAYVHAARGNPAGVATNLRGARARVVEVASRGWTGSPDLPALGGVGGPDLAALLDGIDDRLARVAALEVAQAAPPGTLPDPPHDVAGPPGRARRPPLDLAPLPLPARTTR